MRIGISVGYDRGFRETARDVRDLESAGLDVVSVAEAYSFDAASQLGYWRRSPSASSCRARSSRSTAGPRRSPP